MRILIAEDNDADIYLLEQALISAGMKFQFEIAVDGEAMLTILDQISRNATAQPDAMILDLNLTTHVGTQIMERVRQIPALGKMPVVVFTSSDSLEDRRTFEHLGVKAYFRKPMDLETFMHIGREITAILNKHSLLTGSSSD